MPTNEALANKYLGHMTTVLRRAPASVHRYRNRYAELLRWAEGRSLGSLTTSDLNDFLARPRRAGREVAPATIAHEIALLRSLFGYLHGEGLVPVNPTLRLVVPRLANDDPKPVPEDIWLRLWHSNLTDDERVAYGLAYFCGFRRHEVTLLRVAQFVDVPVPTIAAVKRKGNKHVGFRWRSCIQLYEQRLPHLIGDPSLFTDALSRLRQRKPEQTLLPWRDVVRPTFRVHEVPSGIIPPEHFNYHLDETLKRLALPHVTPHMLRHSFGTNLCRVGVPIQVVSKLMGHANIQITMRYVSVGVDPLADFLAPEAGSDELVEVSPYGGG